MKKLLLKIFIFCIPVFLFLLIPVISLVSSGENFKHIDDVIKKDNKYIIGYGYNEFNYRYLKWKYIASKPRTKVMALGSSRVLQFRREMFNVPFYNAGYTVNSIADFIPFLTGIPANKLPEYLIIGLDQWMFNSNYDNLRNIISSDTWQSSFTFMPNAGTIRLAWKGILNRKHSIYLSSGDSEHEKIGINAMLNNTGFRNDGSMFYGSQIQKLLTGDSTASDYKYSDTYSRIKTGTNRFEYGKEVNPKALEELNKLLKYCKDHNIYVVALIPPFADKVNEKLAATNKYAHIKDIFPKCQPYISRYGFELYDMSSLQQYGSSDNETIDGFHGGELAYLKMLIKMLQSNSVLNNVTDKQQLENDVLHPINNYQVYAY